MNSDFNMLNYMMNNNFLRLSKTVLNSYYYIWVLTFIDKIVIQTLWNTVGFKKNEYYSKGLLVSNIKRKTLSKRSGISVSAIDTSLAKLDMLGVAIKMERSRECNKYIVGFRTSNNDSIYLLYYLILKYEDIVKEDIQKQWDIIGNKRETPKVCLIDNYCLDLAARDFIIKNINRKSIFINRDTNNEMMLKYLFDSNDYYEDNKTAVSHFKSDSKSFLK